MTSTPPAPAPCLTPDEALALLDGRVAPARAAALDAHVADCGPCRRLVAAAARSDGPDATAPASAAEPATAAAAPRRGDRVDRYVLGEPLGRGGMGVVFRARDETLGRDVAIKLVLLDGPGAQARALREARALARLSHPNVVAIHDAGDHGGTTFIAMELVAGVSLDAWLAAAPRAPAQVLAVIADVAAGLAAAHDLGLIHRDVKPGNILVGDDGRSRIADFGLARDAAADPRRVSGRMDAVHTRFVGTPAYMAPEQLRGEPLDARVDQFALAFTAWQALFGEAPFPSTGLDERLAAHDAWDVDAPPPRRDGVAPHVGAALRRALATDPRRRFPDVRAFVAALAPPPTPRAPRHAAWIAGVAAVGVAVVALALVLARPTPARAPRPPDADAGAARETFAITPAATEAGAAALEAGKAHFLAQRFDAAAAEFERALAHVPVSALAFQLGVSFRDAAQPALARRFFSRARDLGDPGQRAAAEDELAKLPGP